MEALRRARGLLLGQTQVLGHSDVPRLEHNVWFISLKRTHFAFLSKIFRAIEDFPAWGHIGSVVTRKFERNGSVIR
jgi:hypothetical protein